MTIDNNPFRGDLDRLETRPSRAEQFSLEFDACPKKIPPTRAQLRWVHIRLDISRPDFDRVLPASRRTHLSSTPLRFLSTLSPRRRKSVSFSADDGSVARTGA